MATTRNWTAEQDAWLREAYPVGAPDDLVAEHKALFGFGRSAGAIQNRATKVLGVHKGDTYSRRCGANGAQALSREEAEWLREMYAEGDIHDTLDAFEARFGRRPSKRGMYVAAHRLGLKKLRWGAEHDARAQQTMRWSQMPEEKEWMMEHAAHPAKIQDVIDGFEEEYGIRLCRSQVSLFRAQYGLARRRSHGGGRPRVPVGTERMCKGYVIVKVAEEAVVAQSKDNWKLKHVWIWEQANGRELPKDHMVLFADGDKLNFDPENLVACEKRLIGPINQSGHKWHDRETLEACIAMAKLKVTVNDLEHRIERTCGVCGKRFVENEDRRRWGSRAQTCPECVAMGRKAPGKRNGKGAARCIVCGRKFQRGRTGQRRCPACIAERPTLSPSTHARMKEAHDA